MSDTTRPDETPTATTPPLPSAVPTTSATETLPTATPLQQPAPSASRVQRAARTLIISGLLLIFFFFSPFVSCGTRTMTGVEAFQESLPSSYSEPKDGLVIILFPIVGALAALIGYTATRRLASGAPLTRLRSISVTVFVLALLTICPIFTAFVNVQMNNGRIQLEWGFYASMLASFALIWAGFELLLSTSKRGVVDAKRACPSCGTPNQNAARVCAHCGATLEPTTPTG